VKSTNYTDKSTCWIHLWPSIYKLVFKEMRYNLRFWAWKMVIQIWKSLFGLHSV